MQAFLKVLVCAALSGALILPQEGAALPFGLQVRQVNGGASGSFEGSLNAGLPDLSPPTIPSLPTDTPDLATPTIPSLPTDTPDLATPTIPSLPTDTPDLATPTLPSLTTGLPSSDLPEASAVYSSLSSALNALPTGDATSQTQAFESFLKKTLGSFEDVIGGNFDGIPNNLGDSGNFNTPDLPQPLTTLYAVFNNALKTLFDSLNLDIPSPALDIVPTDGDDTPAPTSSNDASADLTSAKAGSASADLNTANTRDVSADDETAVAGTASAGLTTVNARDVSADDETATAANVGAGLTSAFTRREGYKFNFDLNNLLKELTSSFNQLIDSYGVDGYE
jgi:hypothetical protein